MRRSRLCSLFFIAVALVSELAFAQTRYVFHLLDTLGGTQSQAYGINNLGQIVGWSSLTGDASRHATLWKGGIPIDLGTLGESSEAYGINDAGQIVGYSSLTGGVHLATLWNGGTLTDLGTLGGTQSRAYGINNLGQIVGGSLVTRNAVVHATFWNGGTLTDLGTLGGSSSGAGGINNLGQIVGWSSITGGASHATLWNGGTPTDLGTLGGNFGYAVGINNLGQIVGGSTLTGDAVVHATFWNGGIPINLGTLGGSSQALGINNLGQIVGSSMETATARRAFLWNGRTLINLFTLIDVDTLNAGWVPDTARGINDAGWIVGVAWNWISLKYRAFLMIPVSTGVLIDPVPLRRGDPNDLPLLDGSTITKEEKRLAVGGRVVKGVAADGVAQVVIRIPATNLGEHFTVKVQPTACDPNAPSGSVDENGLTFDPRTPPTPQDLFGNSTGPTTRVTAVNVGTTTSVVPMAFAAYRAPVDFVRPNTASDEAASERTEYICITSDQTGALPDVPVTIVRPPVALIHGVWSNRSAWKFFKPIADNSNPRFKSYKVDYSATMKQGVPGSLGTVGDQLETVNRYYRTEKQVASVTFDAVVHSMGGLIARALSSDPTSIKKFPYGRGLIHKLITLDTPHLGSPFAQNLLNSGFACRNLFEAQGKPVGVNILNLVPETLNTSNSFLHSLNSGFPTLQLFTHAIVGVASSEQTMKAEEPFNNPQDIKAYTFAKACSDLLPVKNYAAVLGVVNDLIVGENSQAAQNLGVNGPIPRSSPPVSVVHSVAQILFPSGPDVLGAELNPTSDYSQPTKASPRALDIVNHVIDLLNKPVTDPAYYAAIRH
jgi:probable HAF family extracellular repeat protein